MPVMYTLENVLAGVDDAGRGPVIGPMVIAGVSIGRESLTALSELGVRDSKTLSPQRREELSRLIRKVARVETRLAGPREIDAYVSRRRKSGGLNLLEARMMAEVIEALNPEVAYVDSCDVLPRRFGRTIADLISSPVRVIAEHKADARRPLVSAASIIAKVVRDREIRGLKKAYGEVGSGYTSDPTTQLFLKSWFEANGGFPECVRLSWKTVKRVECSVKQMKSE